MKSIGYLSWPSFDLRHPGILRCLKRLAPTLLGIGVYAVDVMIGRRMLSELEEGSVTYFTYALRLCDFSQGIFVMALSAATLPSLSTFVARGELHEVSHTLAYSLRLSLLVGLAASCGSIALAEPLVRAVFEHGQFSRHDSIETTRAFIAQGAGIFLVAGVRQLVIVFFALGKTRVPVYVAIVDILVFATVGLGLRDTLGHVGISWGVTAARISQFLLLWWALKRTLPPLPIRQLARSALIHALAGLTGALLCTAFLHFTPQFEVPAPFNTLLRLVLGSGLFAVGFFSCAHWLKSEELRTVVGPLRRRFGLGRK